MTDYEIIERIADDLQAALNMPREQAIAIAPALVEMWKLIDEDAADVLQQPQLD